MSNYADVIGDLKVENAPPKGIETIKWWVENAPITSQDKVLDLACSTGFSSRNIAHLTGANSIGVDISRCSIKQANQFARMSSIEHLSRFENGDAEHLHFDDMSYSVCVVGSVFGFFKNRERALAEAHRVLKPGGKLLCASFFFHDNPPEVLLDSVEQQIGFRPSPTRTCSYWRSFFQDIFSLKLEKITSLPVLMPDELQSETDKMLANVDWQNIDRNDHRIEQFIRTRFNLNNLRKYQGIALWIYERS